MDIAGCFNCVDPKHMLKDCKKPLNASRAAAKKPEYFKQKDSSENSVQLVLADPCKQLDGISPGDDSEDGSRSDPNDVELLQATLHGYMESEESGDPAPAISHPEIESNKVLDAHEIFVLNSSCST